MALKVRVAVDIDDTMRKLNTLRGSLKKKVVRKAATRGGQALVRRAKALAPVRVTFSKGKQPGRRPTKNYKSTFQTPFTIGGVSGSIGYDGGLLKKSLGYKVKVYQGRVAVAICGPRIGFRRQIGVVQTGKRKGQPIYADPRKYAHLVEFGTRHSAPKPFLYPAASIGAAMVAAVLRAETARVIQSASRS